MAPGNILCHHNSHLMGHFKYLHGSRMTCLPLNISEKQQEKARRDYNHCLHIFVNMIFFAHSEEQHRSFKKREALLFFHSYIKPVPGRILVHSVLETHVLVIIVELIWLLFLNILFLNFVQTLNKFLRFRRI